MRNWRKAKSAQISDQELEKAKNIRLVESITRCAPLTVAQIPLERMKSILGLRQTL